MRVMNQIFANRSEVEVGGKPQVYEMEQYMDQCVVTVAKTFK